MTDRKGYVESLYHGFGQTLAFFMRQVPASVGARLDLEVLRRAISVQDEHGERILPEVWDYRPDSEAAFQKRAQGELEWQQWSDSQKRFIPSLAHQSQRRVLDDSAEGMHQSQKRC